MSAEFAEPSVRDFLDGDRIQEMVFVSPHHTGGDDIGAFQDAKMLTDRLPCHTSLLAKLCQGLSVPVEKSVQQFPALGVCKRFEYVRVDGLTRHEFIICNYMVACQVSYTARPKVFECGFLNVAWRLAVCSAGGFYCCCGFFIRPNRWTSPTY